MVRINDHFNQSTKKNVAPKEPQFVGDKAFRNAGQTGGLEIWRIEKLEPVAVSGKDTGKFHSGDSYIVLHTSEAEPKEWNIHFWLGKESSQDEQGVAAIKTVELDDLLGGSPVQHRETQGYETKKFLSLFKSGVRYLDGGVASGFKHVDRDQYTKRLFQIKGKRNCRIHQVEVSRESLNQGDVFILDEGLNIYVWIGPQSSKAERQKGALLARQIRDEERQGRAHIHIVEDKWDSDPTFFAALGSRPGYIKTEVEGGDDAEFEKREHNEIKLFKVSDATGKMVVSEVKERPLKKEMLDTNDCFILDMGVGGGIFAWVGRGCTKEERQTVWTKATEFLKHRNYPSHTPVTRLNEGCETSVFKQAFDWPHDGPLSPTSPTGINSRVAKIDQNGHQVDVKSLHQRPVTKAKDFIPDDGSGDVQVWRVENFYLVPVEKRTYGTFYSGDSYVILYEYLQNGIKKGIVYFWQGLKSSNDEKAAAAIMAAKIDEKEMDGQALQIRVVQNKEPEHFMKIFGNRLVILMGGHASGFKNINDTDSYDTDGTRLFQIRDARVMQVPEKAASLNSNDMFVLETPQKTFIWHGEGASEQERALSKEFAKMVIPLKSPVTIRENEEPEEFWRALGGKANYASGERLKEEHTSHPARLFHCTNAVGYFRVEEVVDFSQEDLIEDDVMLLDTFDEIFVWIGKNANETEKKEAMKTALEYLRTDHLGRKEESTTILTVKQGFEPPSFTGHFLAWDADKWSSGKSYEELKRELGEENTRVLTIAETLSNYSKTYSADVLRERHLPEGVDPLKKEEHLHEHEFEHVFGMHRDQFNRLSPWKQNDLKKRVGLF